MTKDQASHKLSAIRTQCSEILGLLEQLPPSSVSAAAIRNRTAQLRGELETEFLRTQPERVQKSMTIFELSIYAPTIEEAWKESGIRRLKIEGKIDWKWKEVIEAVTYKLSKYVP